MGFTLAQVSETWDRNNALKNTETRVRRERREILNRFALAYRLGDEEAIARTVANIRAFNSKPVHRAVAITQETLERSLSTRARNTAKREDGFLIQNENFGRLLRERLPQRLY